MVMHYRPREHNPLQRNPLYAPSRDIGHHGVSLIRASAIAATDERFQEGWYKGFIKAHAITREEHEAAWAKMADTLKLVISEPDPTSALGRNGFHDLPPALQLAVYGKMGQVLLSAAWHGIKDVSFDTDPVPRPVLDLVKTVEDCVARGAVVRARKRHSWIRRQAIDWLEYFLRLLS